VNGAQERIREAVDFVMGTASDRFYRIETDPCFELPPLKSAPAYLLEVDGVGLPIPISPHMVITVHNNRPGVLLILLSALASRSVNVLDLQLGSRGERGFAVLGIDGDHRDVAAVLTELGPQFYEANQIVLPTLETE
jgi:histidinol-phosphatase (PHP family)